MVVRESEPARQPLASRPPPLSRPPEPPARHPEPPRK